MYRNNYVHSETLEYQFQFIMERSIHDIFVRGMYLSQKMRQCFGTPNGKKNRRMRSSTEKSAKRLKRHAIFRGVVNFGNTWIKFNARVTQDTCDILAICPLLTGLKNAFTKYGENVPDSTQKRNSKKNLCSVSCLQQEYYRWKYGTRVHSLVCY